MKNFIKYLTIFLCLNIYLFAVDVSNFDIKGVKLDMTKKEALRKMPCLKKTQYSREFSCKINSKNKFTINLDYSGKIYEIVYEIYFSVKPNFKKLESRLVKKYHSITSSHDEVTSGFKRRDLCWGSCRILHGMLMNTSGTGLVVYLRQEEYSNESPVYAMTLILTDNDRKRKFKENERIKVYKEFQRKKNKATNIDF